MVCVIIDGNIGAGKTTQLDLLEQKGFKVQREPIDQWPLEEFYKDPSRWSFLFHMVVLKTQQKPHGDVIYERSLYSSRYVFWKVLLKNKLVNKIENDTYEFLWDRLAWAPDVFIYLDKDPEVAYQHIRSRHQSGDDGVTLEYLKELDAEYKELLKVMPSKVIVVNANQPVDKIHEEICNCLVGNELFFNNPLRQKV
jgi:deoxyadenosine/deoxycytidine kinase